MASMTLNANANRMATTVIGRTATSSVRPMTSMMSPSGGMGFTPTSLSQIQEGKYTSTIYTFIRDGRYLDVIKILSNELQSSPKSRAALSLLGYCYYQVQDYNNATEWLFELIVAMRN
jgi:tetratricopeptide repeat protein 30